MLIQAVSGRSCLETQGWLRTRRRELLAASPLVPFLGNQNNLVTGTLHLIQVTFATTHKHHNSMKLQIRYIENPLKKTGKHTTYLHPTAEGSWSPKPTPIGQYSNTNACAICLSDFTVCCTKATYSNGPKDRLVAVYSHTSPKEINLLFVKGCTFQYRMRIS